MKPYLIAKGQMLKKAAAVTVLLLSILNAIVLKAQTSKSPGGAWESGSSWTGGSSPSLNADVTINHPITFTSGSLTGYSATTITINSTLTVTGGFDLTGSGIKIVINPGGKLIVTGATTTTNSASITVKGTNGIDLKAYTSKSAGKLTINPGASGVVTSLTTTSNNDAIVDNFGTLTVNGAVNSSGIVTNKVNATMTVTGNLTQNNTSNHFDNYGNINVGGNVFAYGQIQLYPGTSAHSEFVVTGNLTVDSNPWLIVGTDVSACGSTITYYADAVIKGNLILTGSGYVVVKQNGRLVVFKDFDGTSGTGNNQLSMSCGAQVYVDGKIALTTGGGSSVSNGNSASSPTGSDGTSRVGLYVNGTTTAQSKNGTIDNKAQLKTNDKPFFDFIGGLNGSPLPVTLVSFKATLANDVVTLAWSTSFERNFDKFIVERSTDGKKFESIGEVIGAGNTTIIQNYSMDDKSPLIGKNYYRLKSVDLDATFDYSKVIYVEFESNRSFKLYPNPSNGESVNFSTNVDAQDNDSIVIIDYVGTIVTTASIDFSTHEIVFNTPLKQGTYLVKYTSGSYQRVERLSVK